MEISLIDPAWHDRFLEQSKDFNLSDESVKELFDKRGQSSASKIEGNIAVTSILGPLTKTKSFYYSLFAGGNTTYSEIIDSINSGENDSSITEHKLRIDSPGGDWGGLTEAVQVLAAAKKPITVEIIGMATSAAYVLASQGDKIISSNAGNEIGGLGVQVRNFEGSEKITRSSNAPNKNPDAFTVKGEKELVKQLDAVEDKAIKMVSEGRSAATNQKITEKVIKKDFGRGASMLADEALSRNMIDEITEAPARVSNSKPVADSGKSRKLESGRGSDINLNNEEKIMDLAELEREHPELCAQLIEKGKTLERDQVKGHIILGESSGAIELCLKNLKEGKEFGSAEVQAGYMAAGMTKKDLKNRDDDNPDGDLTPEGDTELSEKQKEEALVEQAMGLSNKSATKEV